MRRRELLGNSRYSCIDLTPEVNRAFSAGVFEFFYPGALPQALT
jgi:hypothetical protein